MNVYIYIYTCIHNTCYIYIFSIPSWTQSQMLHGGIVHLPHKNLPPPSVVKDIIGGAQGMRTCVASTRGELRKAALLVAQGGEHNPAIFQSEKRGTGCRIKLYFNFLIPRTTWIDFVDYRHLIDYLMVYSFMDACTVEGKTSKSRSIPSVCAWQFWLLQLVV